MCSFRDQDEERDGYRGGGGRYPPRDGGRFGGGMMGNNRNWGGGRDRDRMGPPPRMGGPGSGPNPLMGHMMNKSANQMGYNERKSRFDDGKRRDESEGDEFDRSGRVGPPGVDDEVEEPFDENAAGEDERKRRSRFSDTVDNRGPPGGFRGRGGGPNFRGRGGERDSSGRGMGNHRFGQFRPNNNVGGGRGGGGGFNRNRDDSNPRYFGGRGGGQQGRDNRDNRVRITCVTIIYSCVDLRDNFIIPS